MIRARLAAMLFAILAILSCDGSAQAADGPEGDLLAAMSYAPSLQKRLKEPGPAIRAYIAAGLVSTKPDRRMDYVDYRILKSSATLLGQQLLVLEEEYMTKYIGCCVNAGVGAIVRTTSDTAQLRRFAKDNRCKLDEKYVAEDLRTLGLFREGETYLAVSCRERDELVD